MARQSQEKIKTTTLRKGAGAAPDPVAAICELSTAQEAALRSEALALPVDRVQRLPGLVQRRIGWMGDLWAVARRDLTPLGTVPLQGGALTRAELDAFGRRIEFLRRCVAAYQRTVAGDPGLAGSGLEQVETDLVACKKNLLAAFDLRFQGNPEGKRLLRNIRKGRGLDDLLQDLTQILAMCNDPLHRDWLRTLPQGEADDVARVATLRPRLEDLHRQRGASALSQREAKDLADRAYSLAKLTVDRILLAGRYRFARDRARRADYAGYRAPSRPTREATPAPAPAPVPVPSGGR